jgi:aldehyde dehydrogenase (NAD+)
MGINRVICVDSVYDKFLAALVAAAKEISVGDPKDPNNFMGPIIDQDQLKQIEQYIDSTIKAGAKVALEGWTEGRLMYPWIFSEVTMDMPVACNETFGPICCVLRAGDADEAVRIANDTEYGLSGCIFTGDVYRGMQLAGKMRTGMVHINDQSINDEPNVMFGGVKHSGLGRFNGKWVFEKFTTDRWISVQKEYRF